MTLEEVISIELQKVLSQLYTVQVEASFIQFQKTRKEFEGDITLVVFPLLKFSGKNPEQTANDIGNILTTNIKLVEKFNCVKGFLNLTISDDYWINSFKNIVSDSHYGFSNSESGKTIMVEYSSPNTNKPLHLGHIRNILLGHSVAQILKANGHKVIKTQIVNDRGIHICKSMYAWKKLGKNETPDSTHEKGDKFVGRYYVAFDQQYKKEVAELIAAGKTKDEAEKTAPSIIAAQEMLLKWEGNDNQIRSLWSKMNHWVYDGFSTTYRSLGVKFDIIYYESNTYLYGKAQVLKGVEEGVFLQREDGSVWCDLTKDGLDEKLLLRSDGTSVYMTQDIGTAIQRFQDYPEMSQQIYTVGNEQDYHFRVLFLILEKLGYKWARENYHLSYGMIELPSGKMKSREGTVVDADDIINEMYLTAKATTEELGKLEDMPEDDKMTLFNTIGLGALKYFILKVDPKKKMLFNPEESIDFSGNTGSFIQYTYARIQSIKRKASNEGFNFLVFENSISLRTEEKSLIKLLCEFPSVVSDAGKNYSPALIANYIYELVKEYNHFYQAVPILKEESTSTIKFRVMLSDCVGRVIKSGMFLLGINVPEKM